jgi:hypothetical protein
VNDRILVSEITGEDAMKKSFQNSGHFRDMENLCIKTSPPAPLSFKDNEGGRRAVRVMCLLHNTLLLIFTLILIIGCSKSQPISPDDNDNITSIPIIAPSTIPDGFTATGILGVYDFVINPDDMSYELNPSRSAELGQSYIVNAKSYFTITPCQDCLKIKRIAYDYPWIRADFLVSHPFEKGNVSEPPSGKNRLDLDIFDPMLIVVPLEDEPTEPHLIDIDIFSKSCGFADGYTRELMNVINNEYACPYFLVVDDSDTGISTWNRFEMSRKDQQFSGWFEGGHFELFLTFGYGISTRNFTERLNPTYYNPEFNRKAAWKVNVIPPEHGWSCDNPDDKRDVIVEVYDWQIGATVDSALADPSSVYESSEVLGVGIEISGMTNTLQIQTVPDGTHTGRPDDPLIYTVSIANENLLPGGYYTGYVKVLDKRNTPQTPFDGQTDSLIDIPDGVTMDFVSIPEFATYQIFTAEVWTNEPPCADLDVSDYFIDSGRSIQMFPGPATDDPDGVIIRYEYDFDYQGGIFYPETSNTTGDPVTSPPFYNNEFGQVTRKVAMRVTDNGYPKKSDVGVETITIYPENHDHWAVTWGSESSDETTHDLKLDTSNNILICGCFLSQVDFDPSPYDDIHTSNGRQDCFVSKYDIDKNYKWSITWGGTENDRPYEMVIDSSDNIYVVGSFKETVDFDPGPDEEYRTAIFWDAFFVKFSSEGQLIWAKTWGGEDGDIANSTDIDSSGNLYITGNFSGIVDFDPSGNECIKSSWNNCDDTFISKFDADGNFLWVITFIEQPNMYDGSIDSYCCRLNASGDIFVTGNFGRTIDFNPDPYSKELHEAAGSRDSFVLQLDSDGRYKKVCLWNATHFDVCSDIVFNSCEEFYVVGKFSGPIDLDPGPDEDLKWSYTGGTDYYVCKFDPDFNYLTGFILGGEFDDYINDIVIDNQDSVYLAGRFHSSVDFDPSDATDIRSTPGYEVVNGFITKLDKNSGYLGTSILKSDNFTSYLSLALFNGDLLITSGEFGDTVDFDPTSYGTEFHTSNGGEDIFLSRM